MLSMALEHLLIFGQGPPLVKPSHKCEVKISKAQEAAMSSDTMLSKRTIELGLGNKGFFTYPFIVPKENRMSHVIMNLKPFKQFIICTKLKMTTLIQIWEAIHPGHWAVSLDTIQHSDTSQQQVGTTAFSTSGEETLCTSFRSGLLVN